MKTRISTILLFALILAACAPKSKEQTGFALDDQLIVLGSDSSVYPEPGEDGEISDEEWEDFSYQSEFYILSARSGELLSEKGFAHLSSFSEGLAVASDADGCFYYVNQKGEQVIRERFKAATFFSEDRAWVLDDNDEFWVIDKSGKKLFTVGNAAEVHVYNEGKTVVTTLDAYTEVYDRDGNMLLSTQDGSSGFVSSDMLIVHKDGGSGLIDLQGSFVLSPDYHAIGALQWFDMSAFASYVNRVAAVVHGDDGCGVVSLEGEEIVPLVYSDAVLDGKYIFAATDNHALWFDYRGSKVIEGGYDAAYPFGDGKYAAVCDDGLWGFVDEEGHWTINPQWTFVAGSFDAEGRAVVHDNETMMAGLINESGAYVIPAEYAFIARIGRSDRYLLSSEERYGIASADGRMILQPQQYTLTNSICDYSHYSIHCETN